MIPAALADVVEPSSKESPHMTRPLMHFRPARHWMNDPNGLVFHDGSYHLFYQYNPEGSTHGFMSWGHATSLDLTHWQEHPVALRYTDEDEIFSGSVVHDEHDTSGLGVDGVAPLVAVYTLASRLRPRQAQGIASSTDGGLTWTPYPGNPVLDRASADFRDPKVFRYRGEAGEYWVMVAVEAVERRVVLYRSDDLIAWTPLSDYGPRGAVGGVWECPDLFPLAVDGDQDDVRWVLLISLNPGGIAGGSGTQYVIGSFDGERFTPDDPAPAAPAPYAEPQSRAELEAFDWIDYGRDCYAGVTFSGLADDQRILIAWMSNWDYAADMPAEGEDGTQRGAMTLPRRLSLTRRDGRIRLVQTPVAVVGDAVDELEAGPVEIRPGAPLELHAPRAGRMRVRMRLGDGAVAELRIGDDEAPAAVLRCTAAELTLDRRGGAGELPAAFGSVERLPLDGSGVVDADLWLDHGSVEVFCEDGAAVLTDRIPARTSSSLALHAVGGSVRVDQLTVAPVADAARTEVQA